MGDRRREVPDYADYRPPIPVEGGIRARSRRGSIGETWWSRRFLVALEDYYGTTESRLERGRRYARAGQTTELRLEPGAVRALVQGSRPKPYRVEALVTLLSDEQWHAVEQAMASRAVFMARLLSGEMPDEIEEAFGAASVSLFPERRRRGKRGDLVTTCTCPDSANPCKHIAAVFYLLAESFDRDPFRMFEWRGRDRERLVSELRALRPQTSRPGAAETPSAADAAPAGAPSDSAPDLDRFWNGGTGWLEVRIDPRPAAPPDALVREMPQETLAVLGAGAPEALRAIYLAAARAARRRLDPLPEWPSTDGHRAAGARRRRGA